MIKTATTAEPTVAALVEICRSLHRIAQKHVATTAFADVNELLHVSEMLATYGVSAPIAARFKAATADHIPAVARQSAEYRLMRDGFRAALTTIADLGSKDSKTHKSEYHAGIHAGLRKAAKIAIMFLEDLKDDQPIAPKQKNVITR